MGSQEHIARIPCDQRERDKEPHQRHIGDFVRPLSFSLLAVILAAAAVAVAVATGS